MFTNRASIVLGRKYRVNYYGNAGLHFTPDKRLISDGGRVMFEGTCDPSTSTNYKASMVPFTSRWRFFDDELDPLD